MPPRSSSPSSNARRPSTWTALCAVVPGLLLGFAAGVELARAGAESQPIETPRTGDESLAIEMPRTEAESLALEMPRNEAESRVIETPPTHASMASLASPPRHLRPALAIEGPAGPSRRSVQAEIQATDPEPWLSRFGEVHTASLEEHP